jgi:hypothetical protein
VWTGINSLHFKTYYDPPFTPFTLFTLFTIERNNKVRGESTDEKGVKSDISGNINL